MAEYYVGIPIHNKKQKSYPNLDAARRAAVYKLRRNKEYYMTNDEFVTIWTMSPAHFRSQIGYAALDYAGKPIWCEAGKSVYRHTINNDGSIRARR